MGATPTPTLAAGAPGSVPTLRRVLPYMGVFFVLALSPSALGPTLPALAEQTGASLRSISLLFTARSLGYVVMTFAAGRLLEVRAGHPLIAGSLVAMGVLLCAFPLIPCVGLLLLVMLSHGMASGFVDIGTNTLLLQTFRERVGPYINGMHFCYGLGAFVAPIVVAQVLGATGGIAWAYWTTGVVAFPVAWWVMRVPSLARPVEPRPIEGERIDRKPVWMLVVFFFMYAGVEASFSGWIYSFAVARNLAGVESAAYLNSLFWGGLTIGRLLSVIVAARIRPRRMLQVHLVWTLASIGLVAGSTWLPGLIWAGALSLGLALSTIFPTTLAFAERHLPVSGAVTSRFFLGASVSAMTIPLLIGQLFESHGPVVLLVAIFASASLATLDMALVMRIWKKS